MGAMPIVENPIKYNGYFDETFDIFLEKDRVRFLPAGRAGGRFGWLIRVFHLFMAESTKSGKYKFPCLCRR